MDYNYKYKKYKNKYLNMLYGGADRQEPQIQQMLTININMIAGKLCEIEIDRTNPYTIEQLAEAIERLKGIPRYGFIIIGMYGQLYRYRHRTHQTIQNYLQRLYIDNPMNITLTIIRIPLTDAQLFSEVVTSPNLIPNDRIQSQLTHISTYKEIIEFDNAYRAKNLILMINEELKNQIFDDKSIMLPLIQGNWDMFRLASEKLRSDREVVLTAVCQYSYTFQFASEDLQSDRDFILAAVQQNGIALEYVSENFRSDKEVVLTAVRQNGFALRFASENLRSDKEVVLAAVRQEGDALEFASENLQQDVNIRLAAGL